MYSSSLLEYSPAHNILVTRTSWLKVQGGEDPWDAPSCRSFSTKEPLNIGHFCGNLTYEDKGSYESSPHCTLYGVYCMKSWLLGMLLHVLNTGWPRPIGCLHFIDHVPQKSPITSGFFAKRDPNLQALYGSSPPCRSTFSSRNPRTLWVMTRHST